LSKKPRFDARNPSTLAADALEKDAILELDEIGRRGQQTKRTAVELDGYESDSSTENFDARAAERGKVGQQPENGGGQEGRKGKGNGNGNGKSKDEEEDDMFADLEEERFKDGDEDEEVAREGKVNGKRKEVRFLKDEDIEGQVEGSKSGGHVSADFSLGRRQRDKEVESSSDSGGDEERDRMEEGMDEEVGAGGKKRHAPRLDAFNLKGEKEEGGFDESGNFVRKATDPDAVHDSWLEGVKKSDMKKAREAHEKREEDRRKREREHDEVLLRDVLAGLIVRLDKGESVLEALQRLNKGRSKQKQKPKWQKSKRKNGDTMDVDVADTAEDEAETRRKEAVEAITEAADQLLTRGQIDIYEEEREMLMRQYKKETGEDWIEPAKDEEDTNGHAEDMQWEYRWNDARDGGEIHGPYHGSTMGAWNDAGYFGEGVEFRQIGDGEWTPVAEFV